MAVRGMDGFREFFKNDRDSFAVIGGCACSEWCGEEEVEFRSTQDIDMVLLLETKQERFFQHFWEYIQRGGYKLCKRENGSSVLFRFTKPADTVNFPKQIELLTGIENIAVPSEVGIIHLKPEEEEYSLSAILMQPEYYDLVKASRIISSFGLPVVRKDVLPLLKVKAHLNLLLEKQDGRFVSDHNLTKHRNDVFHLSYLLRGRYSDDLSPTIREDLENFLKMYSPDNSEWESIRSHLAEFGLPLRSPAELIQRLREYYFHLRGDADNDSGVDA